MLPEKVTTPISVPSMIVTDTSTGISREASPVSL